MRLNQRFVQHLLIICSLDYSWMSTITLHFSQLLYISLKTHLPWSSQFVLGIFPELYKKRLMFFITYLTDLIETVMWYFYIYFALILPSASWVLLLCQHFVLICRPINSSAKTYENLLTGVVSKMSFVLVMMLK